MSLGVTGWDEGLEETGGENIKSLTKRGGEREGGEVYKTASAGNFIHHESLIYQYRTMGLGSSTRGVTG